MKREARIILPILDNQKRSLNEVHDRLRRDLGKLFGGYTLTPGRGGWLDDDGLYVEETVYVYDVAIEYDASQALRTIAKTYCKLANQEAIYIRLPYGDVEFVTAD